MKNVKGFNKLTKEQQQLLITTNQRHKTGVGTDYKEGWTPVSVKPLLMMMVMALDEGKGMLAEIKEIFTEEVNETYDPYK